MQRAKNRPLTETVRSFVRGLAEQDASAIPMLPKTHDLVETEIHAFTARLATEGRKGTLSAIEMEGAIAEYGRTLQKRSARQNDTTTVFKIVQKRNKHAVYASGFHSLGRAEQWLADYDPRMWDDKTVQATDLEIVPEA
jgi:hypothetical protein